MFNLNYIPFTNINDFETVNEMSEWFKDKFIKIIDLIKQTKKISIQKQ